jgi:DNA-binding NtrC family response regulator
MPRRVLIVDDDPGIVRVLGDRLRHLGYETQVTSDGTKAVNKVNTFGPDVVLLDLQLPSLDGMEVLKQLRAQGLDTAIIVITAFGTIRRAVEAIKSGAYDFLTKPLDFELVELTIQRALERGELSARLAHWQEEEAKRFPGVIGSSPVMQKVLDVARRVAATDTTVLLQGETGAGKEILARAIHNWSPRAARPFLAVNCTALPEPLLESELFGHEKGAFTGADRLRRGRFEWAAGGTLFFDEVGEIPMPLQAKLLRVLEGHGFERVGGEVTLQNEARIIAANNRDLKEAVQQGRFREDLYHRLNVVAIAVPPLRQRPEDVPELVEFFVTRYCALTKQSRKRVAADALRLLTRYPWPGNVRELENAIERAVVLTAETEIHPEDLPEQVLEAAIASESGAADEEPGYHATVTACRRRVIRDALKWANGNQTAAAKRLGLQRSYLARLIRSLGIQDDAAGGGRSLTDR